MTTPTKPALQEPSEPSKLLSRVLHELAGAASLCWEPKPTGVFDSQRAIGFVEQAIAELCTAIEAAVAEARVVPEGWTDADADAARLALELECLLTDKDVPIPALSRWWDSAHEALRLHRERLAATPSPAEQPKPAAVCPCCGYADGDEIMDGDAAISGEQP